MKKFLKIFIVLILSQVFIINVFAGSDGTLVEADFNTTVENLMSAGADAVISKKPVGAWSHAVTNQM